MSISNSAWNPSHLIGTFEESATLALVGRAKKLQGEGRSIINFGAGEPDFNTPKEILEFAYEKANQGQTKYTQVAGLPQVRKAIAGRLTEDYQVSFDPEDVMVSSGGKQAIYHFFQAVLNPGDEVLIASPYWVSFPEMVKLVGAKPVIVKPSGPNQRLRAEDLEKAISSKTKAFVLNSPSNPAGTVYDQEELQSFLKVIKPHPIWLLTDDTYYRLIYEPKKWVSALKVDQDFKARTCVIGSASKSYAMTGFRIGWAIAPRPITAAMTKLQGQVTSSACAISQAALEAALGPFHGASEKFRLEFRSRKDRLLAGIRSIPKLEVVEPEGAFYAFVKFSDAWKKTNVTQLCYDLLEQSGLCMIPGEAFGAANYARLSYALSHELIDEGLKRIRSHLGV